MSRLDSFVESFLNDLGDPWARGVIAGVSVEVSMKSSTLLLLALGTALQVHAQAPTPATTQDTASTEAKPQPSHHSTKLHADALKMVDDSGAREAMKQNMDKIMEDSRQALFRADPNTDSRFADEWVKRMRERMNLDDYINAIAKVYENYLTDEDILELWKAQTDRKESKQPVLTPQLQEKLKENAVKIQSDVIAETSRLGARLGGEIGQEISKEHPDWVKAPKPTDPSPKH